MAGRNGQELLSTWVPAEFAARFRTWARANHEGASDALRRYVLDAASDAEPQAPLGTAGYRVSVRLKDAERFALLAAARARRTTPSVWLRCLAVVHLGQRPQWNDQEVAELRAVFTELRRIGTNLNQIAKALNVAALSGEYPTGQGTAALEAADLVRSETRRVVAAMTGNFDYWGLPDAERPTAAHGALVRDQDATAAERRKIAQKPRRRPARFEDTDG